MGNNLKVKIAGIEFKNPIIAASGTFGFGKEYNEFFDVSILGGISTKGLTFLPRQGNMGTRIAQTSGGMLNCVGLQNPGVEGFIADDLQFLKNIDTVKIANIAGATEQDYIDITRRLNDVDSVDMLELNISCPNVKAGGMAFGVDPKGVENITKIVKKITNKPLIVKLSPNVANIADNALAAEVGGADAVSLINTITGMAIDYKKRKPVLGNVIGGLSGPAIKPVALRQVYQAYKAVKIPIIGMGGIMTAGDVAEFMLAGAVAVMVGSANIFDPYASINIINELTSVLKDCNISNINELVGALKID